MDKNKGKEREIKYLIIDTDCDNINEKAFCCKDEALEELEDVDDPKQYRVLQVEVIKTFKPRTPCQIELVEV